MANHPIKDTKTYEVWNFNGRNHLTTDGKRTVCGAPIKRAAGWAVCAKETKQDFIDYYRPRCRRCLQSIYISDAIDLVAEIIDEEKAKPQDAA